jgi:hypothetical protein
MMRTRVAQVIFAATFLAVSARAAHADVVASPMSPGGLAMTGLLMLALGWRLVLRSPRTH